MSREKFSSRLGFILISAGCAIGLGNVWRFPYIVGEYGGAAFVLIYLLFLLVLGLPIVVMEFAVGRASQKSAAKSFDVLEPKGTRWHWNKVIAIAGNYLLMMFYTTVAGWMLWYFVKMIKGDFTVDAEGVAGEFSDMLANPQLMGIMMVIVVISCFTICGFGLQNGVEKITKNMMLILLGLMGILAVNSDFNGKQPYRSGILSEAGFCKVERSRHWKCDLCSFGTVLLYFEYRYWGTGYFWKLHWKRETPDRRSDQYSLSGHLSGIYGWSDHFPGMFCLWDQSGLRSIPDLHYPA